MIGAIILILVGLLFGSIDMDYRIGVELNRYR